mmetsp:Transcript_15367/g.28935  ORF Transcript_15367/g.28935 Transcript_15367/m.28935 type:complete len:203 (+) Transcript_15367:67-675(+)
MFSKLLLPFLAVASAVSDESQCNDLAKYRTDYVAQNFDDVKAGGFFYENAYQDLAQVGSSCGYYSKNATGTGDVIEQFGFTYANPNHMMLKYTTDKEAPQAAVYTKKIDKGDDGFGPPISSVVVDVTLSADGTTYESMTEYACFTVGSITYNEIRIGSRSPSMSDEELAEKEKVLADQGIQYRELKVVDHNGCEYDINEGAH